MSQRLTTKFTPTCEEAFGPNGKIGDDGELMVCEILTDQDFKITHHPSDYDKQIAGHDITIHGDSRDYGVDVKTNVKTNDNFVWVDYRKIWNTKATFWYHINRKDPTDFYSYTVKRMRQLVSSRQPCNTSFGKLYKVYRTEFIKLQPHQE